MKKNPGRKERRRLERFNRVENKRQETKVHNNLMKIRAKMKRKPVFKIRLIRFLTGRDIMTGRNIEKTA